MEYMYAPTRSRISAHTPSGEAASSISTLTIFARVGGKHSDVVRVSKSVALPFWYIGHTTKSLVAGVD